MKKKDINKAKRIMKEWHDSHLDDYSEFLKLVNDAMEKGDITMFEKNFHILERALPSKVFEYFQKKENNPLLWDSKDLKLGNLIDSSIRIFKDMVAFVPEFISNFKEQSFDTRDPQLLSMYYWAYFEGGSIKIKEIYSKYIATNEPDNIKAIEFEAFIDPLLDNSILNFMDTKKDWQKDNYQDADPIMKDIVASLLSEVKGVNAGRNDDDKDLEQLLTGNVPNLMKEIEYFVNRRKSDTHLAFILYFLKKAECIEDCEYMTFHRALLRKFPNANIKGYDRAQSLYGTLTNRKDNIGPRHKKKLEELKKEMLVRFIEAK